MLLALAFEPGGEDYRCRHLVGKPLSFAVGLLEAGGQHVAVGHDGGESLVDHLDRNPGQLAAQTVEERRYIPHRLRGLAVHTARFADKDALHRFGGAIGIEKLHQVARAHHRQRIGRNLKHVGHRHSAPLASVVYS